MAYIPRYDSGDWKALCDVCGREFKATQLTKRWDGLMCCRHDWEPRQPQDFVRGVDDNQTVPWSRPEPADYFIPIAFTPPAVVISVNSTASITITLPTYVKKYTIAESTTATLNYQVRPAIQAGAREINGSSINTNSIG
jgi:hypothetical protein